MRTSRLLAWTAVTACCGAVLLGQTKPSTAPGVIKVTPDDVRFSGGSGMQSVVIAGDPAKPGIYVLRNLFPPGVMSRPHFHNQDRFVTVIQGTWWTAVGADGDDFDPAKTVPLPAGSFMKHPAGVHHYDGAKTEAVIVQIIGMGPVTTTSVGGGRTAAPPPMVTIAPPGR